MLSRSVGTPSTAHLPPLLPQRFPAPLCCHVFFYLLVEPPAPTCFPGLWLCGGVLCGQWHAGHGSGLADGGADRFFLPGSAGADGRVSAHVLLALPAGVLADTNDRRRLISGALIAQTAAFALLTLLVLLGWGGPATVCCCWCLWADAARPC